MILSCENRSNPLNNRPFWKIYFEEPFFPQEMCKAHEDEGSFYEGIA